MKKLFLILSLLALTGAGCFPKCIKSHKEKVFHPGWTQFIYVNKTMYPIFHPGYTSLDDICDEYATSTAL